MERNRPPINSVELYTLVTTRYRAPISGLPRAAKVIENIQQDLDIEIMNELSLIIERMGLGTGEG